MHEPKGNQERRERKRMSSSKRHLQQKQQTFYKQRREPEIKTEIALKSERTEIKNQISITLKKKKSRDLITFHAGQTQPA